MNLRAVFMLSTGRAGTGTFAHLMQQSSFFRAFHTPKPEMIEEAFAVQQGQALPSAFVQEKLAGITQLMTGHDDKTYCETNGKLYPFAAELDRHLSARFFWVIRDPFEFVNSGLSRKWYTGAGGIWDENRERPRGGWAPGITQAQKIAWQWCEVNSMIDVQVEHLKNARILHFSDLRSDPDAILELLDWAGATDVTREAIERIFGLRINVGRYSAPRDPQTGDHIFGARNERETEIHDFDHEEVREVIKQHWPSVQAERYLC
jgi:hypothetical protein